VKNAGKWQFMVALGLLGAGLALAGCKSAPPLTQDQAQALIQAKYDAMPPAAASITVDDLGMREGVTAKYWTGTKRYPNGYWGDFQLTPEGKKVVSLTGGGDMIQWRPEGPNDPRYAIGVTTVTTNHLKAKGIGEIQDQAGGTKVVDYTEEVVLAGLPDPLLGIAHNPGNKLSTKRTATFVLSGGAWTLQSID
jgi:hypothetical protein